MGFKLGAVVGFGAGYYLGAKAGRERYEQLNRWAEKAKETEAYGAASAKVKDMAAEGVAVAKARISGGTFDDEPESGDYVPTDFSNN